MGLFFLYFLFVFRHSLNTQVAHVEVAVVVVIRVDGDSSQVLDTLRASWATRATSASRCSLIAARASAMYLWVSALRASVSARVAEAVWSADMPITVCVLLNMYFTNRTLMAPIPPKNMQKAAIRIRSTSIVKRGKKREGTQLHWLERSS